MYIVVSSNKPQVMSCGLSLGSHSWANKLLAAKRFAHRRVAQACHRTTLIMDRNLRGRS